MPAIGQPCIRIVEDDPSAQTFLAHTLRCNGFEVATYDSAEAFIADDAATDEGCVLVDLNLPGMNGLELINWINNRAEPIPTIVISGCGSVELAVTCLRQGAADFMEKPMNPQAMLTRVRQAVASDAVERARRQRVQQARRCYDTLTAREQDVMSGLLSGQSSKQIAYDLGISKRTVETHRARVMEKMHVDSLALLVRAALDLELRSSVA